MKLRNKKTGKIINSKELLTDEFIIDLFSKDFNYFSLKIEKIQDEWEDCDPLIKDEKIRKVVRAWADCNRGYPIYWEDGCTLSIDHSMRIEFSERVFAYLEPGRPYTITELCGEEE